MIWKNRRGQEDPADCCSLEQLAKSAGGTWVPAVRAQAGIEFFLIAGFILLATSVLIAQADRQIRGSNALNNVLVARSALDLETSAVRYVYLAGNFTTITHTVFIPPNASCFYPELLTPPNLQPFRFYCIVPGAAKKVIGEDVAVDAPTVPDICHKSGWVKLTTRNLGGIINVSCA